MKIQAPSILVTLLLLGLVSAAIAKKPLPTVSRTLNGTSFCTPTHSGKYLEAGAGIVMTTNADTIFVESAARAGTVAVTSGQTSVSVTFDSPLPDADYVLMLSASKAATASWASKTASGFTLNLASGINGNVDYIATPIP